MYFSQNKNTYMVLFRPNMLLVIPYNGWTAVVEMRYAVPTQAISVKSLNSVAIAGSVVVTMV